MMNSISSDKCFNDENGYKNLSESRSLIVLSLFLLVYYFSNKNSISSKIVDTKSFIYIWI